MQTEQLDNDVDPLDHVAGAILRNADEIRDLNTSVKKILEVLEEWKK